jgi:hypothetical protein
MYTKILTGELTYMIKNILHKNNTPEKQNQKLRALLNTFINQNYSQFNNQYDGLAIRAPTSAILAKIFTTNTPAS